MKKKKILTISDHPLSTSGVGIQMRWLTEGLLRTGKYQFRQIGAAIKHSDYSVVNVPPPAEDPHAWQDGDWLIRPTNGFGDKNLIRLLMATEKPDAIFLFTDPRFFFHIFEIEDEIHQSCPIVYWHVWDNLPYPDYNEPIYNGVDLFNCHSHLTYTMMKEQFPDITNFVPHGVPKHLYHPLSDEQIKMAREQILGDKKDDFVALWINRNAKRKRPADMVWAWSKFCDKLEKEYGHRNATLILHTDPLDQEGPNLHKVVEHFNLTKNITFSTDRVGFEQMNVLHNIADIYTQVPCYPTGQKVLINGKVKNIEDVKVGDLALTHKGRWMPVSKIYERAVVDEDIYTVYSSNNEKISLTAEHPVWAIKKEKNNSFIIKDNLEDFINKATWVKTKDLEEGDYVVWVNDIEENKYFDYIVSKDGKEYIDLQKLLDNKDYDFDEHSVYKKWDIKLTDSVDKRRVGKRFIDKNKDFAYMLGKWVATNQTNIAFNKKDKLLAEKLLKKYTTVFEEAKITEYKKHLNVGCCNVGESLYSQMFNEICGKHSSGKYIPDFIMKESEEMKEAFIEGYVAGDGCLLKNGASELVRCRTISDNLMIALKMLLISLGYSPKIILEDNSHGYGNGNIWCIEWRDREENNASCRSWNVKNSYIISRIFRIEKENKTCKVYNFEVSQDNSYSNISFMTHNCNEGFGLATLEAMMTGTPVVAVKTGGQTRQLIDHRDGTENGIALDVEFQSLVGSQLVPFIYEDYVSTDTISDAWFKMYEMGSEKRKELGKKAMDYAHYEFDLENIINKWDDTLWETMENWKTRRNKWICQKL